MLSLVLVPGDGGDRGAAVAYVIALGVMATAILAVVIHARRRAGPS